MTLEIDNFDIDYHYATPIFRFNKSEFLESVKTVFSEHVEKAKKDKNTDDPYPGIMTEIISGDERIEDFAKYVSDISWDVLNKEGYNMDLFYTDASEMWGQFHPRFSSMEKHSHGYGNYLTGFYFLDTPVDSSQMYIHDPRAVKLHSDLPMRESDNITFATQSIYYEPKPGDIIFINSWLEHSFTRNKSNLPYNFIHINVRLVPRQDVCNNDSPIIV